MATLGKLCPQGPSSVGYSVHPSPGHPHPHVGAFRPMQREGTKAARHLRPTRGSCVEEPEWDCPAWPCPELAGSAGLWGPDNLCFNLAPLRSLFSPPSQIPRLLGRPQGCQPWLGCTRVSLCPPNVLSKCAGSVCGNCLPSSPGREDRRHSRPLAELGAPGPTSPPSQRRPGGTGSPPRRERAERGIIPFVSPPPAFRGVWHTVGAQQVEKLNTSVMKTWVLIPPH